MIKKLVKNIHEYVTYIPRGEWSYKQYIHLQHKSLGGAWDKFEYVCQIPYVRAVTGPVGMLLAIPLLAIYIAIACIKETMEGR